MLKEEQKEQNNKIHDIEEENIRLKEALHKLEK